MKDEMGFFEWLLTVDLESVIPWFIAAGAWVDKMAYIGMKMVRDIIDTYRELFGG